MSDEAELLILLEGADDVPQETNNEPTVADGEQPTNEEVDAILSILDAEIAEGEGNE